MRISDWSSDVCSSDLTTDNAVTLLTSDRMTVQFITRWTFDNAADLVASFDFTVCQAAIWRNRLGEWKSLISNSFYIDLAGRRLVYTPPEREEEAGGSPLRITTYVGAAPPNQRT